jgi:hypothetical protein
MAPQAANVRRAPCPPPVAGEDVVVVGETVATVCTPGEAVLGAAAL